MYPQKPFELTEENKVIDIFLDRSENIEQNSHCFHQVGKVKNERNESTKTDRKNMTSYLQQAYFDLKKNPQASINKTKCHVSETKCKHKYYKLIQNILITVKIFSVYNISTLNLV